MSLQLTREQELFRDIVAGVLREVSTPEAVRALMDDERGYDEGVWSRLATEAELLGAHVPEEYGGSGLGPVELGIVAEEMGRTLYCGPFFSSCVMAATALLEVASDTAKADLLPGVADGSALTTLVLDSLDAPEQVGHALRVEQGSLHGAAPLVLDAHIAERLLVIAQDGTELGLFLVSAEAAGVEVTPETVMDPTRRLSHVTFDAAPADPLGPVTPDALQRIWDHMCTALAHEMIGGAQHMLDSTVEYTKVRVQFGRPIGSFQALKHRCADLLMEVQLATAVTHHAARCLASGEGEPFASSMAKAMAADAYVSAVKAGVQLRGGIGFTWEDDTHLWFKRAKSSEVFLGTPHLHRERMIQQLEAAS